jgi:hypothetical protein
VRAALRSGRDEIKDLRQRRGIGADAVDDLRNFYEIKMASSADIPDEVTLTATEVAKAEREKDFFLAIVCGLEETSGPLRVRFIVNPLDSLSVVVTGNVTLRGIRNAEGLDYVFSANTTEEKGL